MSTTPIPEYLKQIEKTFAAENASEHFYLGRLDAKGKIKEIKAEEEETATLLEECLLFRIAGMATLPELIPLPLH